MNTLRGQLTSILLGFFFFNLLLTAVTYGYFEKIAQLQRAVDLVKDHQLKVKEYQFFLQNILREGIYQDDYYLDYEYFNFEKNALQEKVLESLVLLSEFPESEYFIYSNHKEVWKDRYQEYFTQVNALMLSIKKRGFRDYGIEGEMRDYAHFLENYQDIIPADQLLMLRRHEKDFMLRQDKTYVSKFESEIERLKGELVKFKGNKADTLRAALSHYDSLFNQLVLYDMAIGLKTDGGMVNHLERTYQGMHKDLQLLLMNAEVTQKSILKNLRIGFIVFIALFICGALILARALSRRATYRLTELSSKIKFFVDSNFTITPEIEVPRKADEVGKLIRNFVRLQRELYELINLFKEKVAETTLELQEEKQVVEEQRNRILQQNLQLEEVNQQFIQSVRYAWRIQEALIPNKKTWDAYFNASFQIFKPRDIVSGDFIWLKKVKEDGKQKILFALIDCTGHGVPGALMSVMAYNALNQAVENHKKKKPNEVLEVVNRIIFKALGKKSDANDRIQSGDGFEICIGSYCNESRSLEFSGAGIPLVVVSKTGHANGMLPNYIIDTESNKLEEFKTTNFSIGAYHPDYVPEFPLLSLKLKKGDSIYVFSDGIVDQFGGEKGKKLKKKNMYDYLLSIESQAMENRKENIERFFSLWSEGYEQTDDVSMLGFSA